MRNKKCIDCSEYNNCKDSYSSWIFFIIGIIATITIRVVTVLIHMDPVYAKIAWYIGVGGFFIFFIYKFRVNLNRTRVINKQNIVDKINNMKQLTKDDYEVVSAILCGLSSRKETINYLFIFAFSAVALLLAVYMDFLR